MFALWGVAWRAEFIHHGRGPLGFFGHYNCGVHRPRWQRSGVGSSAALRRNAIEWTKIQNRLRKRQESRLKSKKEVHHSNVFHFISRDPERSRIAMSVRTMSTFWRRSLLKLIVHLTCWDIFASYSKYTIVVGCCQVYLFLFLQMQFHWCLCEVLQSTSLTTREPLRISMMSKTQRLVKAPLAACAGPHLNARFFWAPDRIRILWDSAARCFNKSTGAERAVKMLRKVRRKSQLIMLGSERSNGGFTKWESRNHMN